MWQLWVINLDVLELSIISRALDSGTDEVLMVSIPPRAGLVT